MLDHACKGAPTAKRFQGVFFGIFHQVIAHTGLSACFGPTATHSPDGTWQPVEPYARCGIVSKESEMRNKLTLAALAVLISVPAMTPAPAFAQRSDDYRRHHVYHGNGGYYRHRCGGGNGAVGTVAGGVGGALAGNALGGGALGTVAGGVGGALLGRHLDKQHTRSRRGC
jgi:hypothetical protein